MCCSVSVDFEFVLVLPHLNCLAVQNPCPCSSSCRALDTLFARKPQLQFPGLSKDTTCSCHYVAASVSWNMSLNR